MKDYDTQLEPSPDELILGVDYDELDDPDWNDFGDAIEEEEDEQRKRLKIELNPEGGSYEEVEEDEI